MSFTASALVVHHKRLTLCLWWYSSVILRASRPAASAITNILKISPAGKVSRRWAACAQSVSADVILIIHMWKHWEHQMDMFCTFISLSSFCNLVMSLYSKLSFSRHFIIYQNTYYRTREEEKHYKLNAVAVVQQVHLMHCTPLWKKDTCKWMSAYCVLLLVKTVTCNSTKQ